MLKNKFILFIITVLFIFSLLCSSVYATDVVENFEFVSFDDSNYSLPSFSEEMKAYKFFIIHKSNTTYYAYFFNETLDYDGTILNGDNGKGQTFTTTTLRSDWETGVVGNGRVYGEIIYCSDELLQYKDNMLNNESFFFNTLPVVTGTLAPIYQETPLEEVLKEIVEVLPVVLMTIVGLIGLRKALKFLLTVLHRS